MPNGRSIRARRCGVRGRPPKASFQGLEGSSISALTKAVEEISGSVHTSRISLMLPSNSNSEDSSLRISAAESRNAALRARSGQLPPQRSAMAISNSQLSAARSPRRLGIVGWTSHSASWLSVAQRAHFWANTERPLSVRRLPGSIGSSGRRRKWDDHRPIFDRRRHALDRRNGQRTPDGEFFDYPVVADLNRASDEGVVRGVPCI